MVTIRSGYIACRTFSNNLFGGCFDHFPAFVLAALRAHPVGQFRFVAVGALGESGLAQSVVGAAVLCARIRVTSFWIGHF
jgi:hypothetical protein